MIKENLTDNKIAIIGGTGKEGKGLAIGWLNAGFEVIIGSRMLEKANSAVHEIQLILDKELKLSGMVNDDAARKADIIVITVPYSVHRDTLVMLKPLVAGKLVIDVTVPIMPPKVTVPNLPPEGSAGLEARAVLGEEVEVVTAFQNISYEKLMRNEVTDCDVLVCGSSKNARNIGIQLVEAMGFTAWDAGPLENSVVAEALTSVLIGINIRHGVTSAGIKITGVKQ
ncbi:MAG: NADPH-dependent F420 reductase [Anaerolineaceae bacterium]|nr:NADPH-dependent F420 reductase [Anaerolineaceae bacterium]